MPRSPTPFSGRPLRMGPRNLVPAREKSAATRNAGETGSSFGRARYHSAHARSPRSCCRSLHPRRYTAARRRRAGPLVPRDALARHRPDACRTRARGWPALPASRTSSTPASITAASGDRRTTAPTGCRSSTINRPDRSARSPSRRRIPNVIYVGPGAGIIRPDLAIGDGMYKSTDAGHTWQHLGLRDTQMIAAIAVDPGNADRLFVAALGHPYGPNAERGVFRSTDGGTHVREGALQGRIHQRQRGPDRSEEPQHRSTRCCGRSNRASSKARDSATPAWASSSPPTAARTGRSWPKDCRRSCRPTSRSRRAIRTSSTPRSRRDRDRSASTSPPTAARTGSRRFSGPGAPAGSGAGHAAARAHRRRRSAHRHHRSQGSATSSTPHRR